MKESGQTSTENNGGSATATDRAVQLREARARGEVFMDERTIEMVEYNKVGKGNVLAAAEVAGVMAAKKTAALLPNDQPIPITHCDIDFDVPTSRDRIVVTARAEAAGRTSVEVHAMTAVSMAALTIYEMCKPADTGMRISEVKIVAQAEQPAMALG